ncbi:MAG: hypothetical protein V1809_08705 [Planctomycetota bacterium]
MCDFVRQGSAKDFPVLPEDLAVLAGLWDKLPATARQTLLTLAQQLAGK